MVNKDDPSESENSRPRTSGRVKWFNNKSGYGFITANCNENNQDIFVHHSTLQVMDDSLYKYLVQGEYVEFDWTKSEGNTHEWQASNVTGIAGGKLMCETRHEIRTSKQSYHDDTGQPSNYPRARGHNSREEGEWMLVRRGSGGGSGGGGNRRGYWKGNPQRWPEGHPEHKDTTESKEHQKD